VSRMKNSRLFGILNVSRITAGFLVLSLMVLLSPESGGSPAAQYATLDELRMELEARENDLTRCLKRLNETMLEQSDINARLNQLEKDLEIRRAAVRRRLAGLHRIERVYIPGLMLRAESGRLLLRRLKLVQLMIRKELESLSGDIEKQKFLRIKSRELEDEITKLNNLQQKLEERRRQLVDAIREKSL